MALCLQFGVSNSTKEKVMLVEPTGAEHTRCSSPFPRALPVPRTTYSCIPRTVFVCVWTPRVRETVS